MIWMLCYPPLIIYSILYIPLIYTSTYRPWILFFCIQHTGFELSFKAVLQLPLLFASAGCTIYVLCGDGPAPLLLLSSCSLLLGVGPRLDLPAAEYGVEESAADVDPGRHPEHFPPALQGVLTTREEEGTQCFTVATDVLHFLSTSSFSSFMVGGFGEKNPLRYIADL